MAEKLHLQNLWLSLTEKLHLQNLWLSLTEKLHLQNLWLSLTYWWRFHFSTIWCHVDWWSAYRPACWLHPPGIYTVSDPRRLESSKLTKDLLVPAHIPIQGPLPTTPTTDPSRRLNIVQPTAPPKEHEPSAPTLDSNTRGPCHSTTNSTQDHVFNPDIRTSAKGHWCSYHKHTAKWAAQNPSHKGQPTPRYWAY
jgi:hypothetical protein